MFSLQRLLGKEDKFFDLLEASAEQARQSVQALKQLTESAAKNKSLEDFVLSRRKEKAINAQISEALCTTFVTALEREDIEALSRALYKIPKTAEKIAERILLSPDFVQGIDFSRQLDMLGKATDSVAGMIKSLRKGGKLQEIKDINNRLQYLEGEMDKLVLEMLKNLYTSQLEGSKVVFLKDIYELLEKVSDRCRDAGNVITHILLKNS
jgi:uncharacterized protein Yka (UPF0111/DUF47 family)